MRGATRQVAAAERLKLFDRLKVGLEQTTRVSDEGQLLASPLTTLHKALCAAKSGGHDALG